MNRMRSLSVGTRLALLVIVCSGLLVAQIVLVLRALAVADAASARQLVVAKNVDDLDDLMFEQSALSFALVQYLNTSDPAWGGAADANFATFDLLLAKQQRIAESEVADAGGAETFEEHMTPFAPMRAWERDIAAPALVDAKEVAAGKAPKSSVHSWVTHLTDHEAVVAITAPAAQYVTTHHSSYEAARTAATAATARDQVKWLVVGGTALVVILGSGLCALIAVGIARRLRTLTAGAERIELGDLQTPLVINTADGFGRLGSAMDAARQALLEADVNQQRIDLAQRTSLALNEAFSHRENAGGAFAAVLSELASRTASHQGAWYLTDRSGSAPMLRRTADYGDRDPTDGGSPEVVSFGEGLLGQAAVEQRQFVVATPPDYLRVESALGAAAPAQVVITPLCSSGHTLAVIELAALNAYTDQAVQLLTDIALELATNVERVLAEYRTEELLEASQAQAEELHAQATELESQHLSLERANAELEERAEALNETGFALAVKNAALERSQAELSSRTELLDRASRYKSQFVSKMSHELRTPLNSILILSERLAANSDGNLVDRQLEFARTIHDCGKDLLSLINDVLDLSKVEAGRVDFEFVPVDLGSVITMAERLFRPIAEERSLRLSCSVEPDVPESITGDRLRIEQILKNLLSNACKFTDEGSVDLSARRARPEERPAHADADGDDFVGFDVTDTGIGISEADLDVAFEAFRQVGGGGSRREGGTGLGLSISRELARAMGGDLVLHSTPGVGSRFTLILPVVGPRAAGAQAADSSALRTPAARTQAEREPATDAMATATQGVTPRPASASGPVAAPDGTSTDGPGKSILIIEDDPAFAALLAEVAAARGFTAVIETTGAGALETAHRIRPAAVSLDIGLPDMNGWVVLDRFRRDPQLRHIPVQIISGSVSATSALPAGVVSVAGKPTSDAELSELFDTLDQQTQGGLHNLLVVEGDETEAAEVARLSAGADVTVQVASTGAEALRLLANGPVDCAVVDLNLSDMSGLELIESIRSESEHRRIPIIVYTAMDLTDAQLRAAERLADSVVIKGERSRARLLDETSLFLHRVEADLPAENRDLLAKLYDRDPVLADRTVLVVDDDPRNVFSLAAVLEHHQMQVLDAENGREAIATLEDHPEIDVVLMDIMMPVMDGHEAIRRIRANPQWDRLPIIALTALAMPRDREQAINAGASDYMSKPVDTDQLVSLLRVWLSR